MSKFKFYYGLKKRLRALILAGFMLLTGSGYAKADTAKANEVLDQQQILENGEYHNLVYSVDDSRATNLVVNAKDVLTEVATKGELPFEYRSMVIYPELTLTSKNNMFIVLLNANVNHLFTDPENFQYLSMGELYMDNEEEKALFTELASMITEFSVSPTMAGLQSIMDFIRKYTPLFSVGGKQALSIDLFYLQALAQVYGLTENELGMEYTQLNDMAASFGGNADIKTYIDAIRGQAYCR